ncbi:hypothetical protein OMP43_05450 [Sphingomonas sp. CBMAI 2297]|uniref:hypothetical protein n=1 Tax=Sphingomonas sp. CBMAI 2297 TaxID=2991720 RepID=UPI002456BCEA|nr:hypothetical protein [Sphingomonas sp. CBMAI 2297]MDH4743456.1 hypothetical protein [Sphingomonas sp. CBMAI 2297]
MFEWIEEYAKHATLNFGQALQGMRYLLTHPRADRVAARGSPRHAWLSLRMRSRLVANDLLFAILPPRWHHSREELAGFRAIPFGRWFQYGYCAWRFTDTGAPREDLSGVDRRWDPRCDDA